MTKTTTTTTPWIITIAKWGAQKHPFTDFPQTLPHQTSIFQCNTT